MKKLFTLLMLIPALFSLAQNSIIVKFTAQTTNGAYLQLDEVEVNNITHNWNQTLTYPDTILILNYIDGIGDYQAQDGLSQNFPNPFYGTTEIRFHLAEAEQADIQVIDMKGSVVTQTSACLTEGEHRISIDLEEPQLALLRVATSKNSYAIKMLNIGQGGSNRIEVNTVKQEKPLDTKAEGNGTFALGDMMSYKGIATIEGETLSSAVVSHQQSESETITLLFDYVEVNVPTVTTNDAAHITTTTATCGGNVTDDGGTEVTARGVCWSTNSNPTTSDNLTTDGTGIGSFTSELTGLNANTTYHVRAYATNSAGTAYGENISFTTSATTPTVSTNGVTDVTSTTAVCGGDVTSDGGTTVTAKGVCWSTNSNPTTSDNLTTDGTGIGNFTSELTGLNANTTYHVRAYATNSEGTAYGEDISFTTSATTPTVTIDNPSNIGTTFASCVGNVSDDGGSAVTERGVCWATNPNPTITDSHTSDGSGLGEFASTLTDLTPGTSYYVRAYATNGIGTAYSEQKTFTTTELPTPPHASTGGVFSVSATLKVYFSKGNLYKSGNAYYFTPNQYNYMAAGSGANHTSSPDLFAGWGEATLTDSQISNGGGDTIQWRILTSYEWSYLLFNRITDSGIRYAKGRLNDVNGLIILPDDWNPEYYALNSTNTTNVLCTVNTISLSDWTEKFESHGAVFLPCSGAIEAEGFVIWIGSAGRYWSSTRSGNNYSVLCFANSTSSASIQMHNYYLGYKYCVRLVTDAD